MSAPPHRKSVPRFIAVGALAALVHLGVVTVLVEAAALSPLKANVLAFLIAFGVSFAGHFYWTFSPQMTESPLAPSSDSLSAFSRCFFRAALWPVLLRFFCIAFCGFVLNQILYAGLLSLLGSHYYLIILGFVLVFVAILTYLFSRFWGFKRP